jgi:hypothetical protein
MKGFVPRLTVSASIAATMILMLVGEQAAQAQSPGAEKNSTSAQDFESIVPVLRHPRCMNCHLTGDYPRQGDDSHPHSMR